MGPRTTFELLARWLWRGALLLGLAVAAAPASAAPADPIALKTCILRDAPGLDARTLLREPGRFDCTTPQRDFGAGDFWLISQPLNVSAVESRYVLRMASVWQHAVTAHVLFADGAMVSIRTDASQASHHVQLGGIIERILPHHAAPIVRVLWHTEGSPNLRGLLLAPTLTTTTSAGLVNVRMAAAYGAFGGLVLALLIYNLALWRVLRYPFLPFYCLMLLALGGYAYASSGAISLAFPDISNTMRMRINYVTLGLGGVSAMAFVRCFFEPRVFTRRLTFLANAAGAGVMIAALGIALTGEWQLPFFDALYSVAFPALISLIVPVLYSAWRRGSEYLGLFALAWGLPIVLALLRCANILGFVPYRFWLDNSTLVAMAVESVTSSLAIAYRIQQISRDRDLAREQELAARVLADIDPLTGLLNRRAFLARAIGREEEQVLLLADIDHFKLVNDTIGHDGGDEVLRVVARTLRQAVPLEALVARFGGEEFAIVVPASQAIEAETVLARLRGARMPFDLTVTASIGVTRGALTRESDWKALYRAADAALFDAKKAGRDRARGQIRRVA
ncbi:diguanylate cyclase [Sphingomonas sp. AR_OL41]|uniref:GGDEF domain-containing protein n=1 Tax=Sphingomonas sp. AR_OL41 TaxID=3042729 RepID=UPI0024812680|nr:diguanylate cyclase [Sphingomonas sp. AR_OL41]MDH7976060.1 diguanylate cyclase [Sphingomonas sp. AR_OL41]